MNLQKIYLITTTLLLFSFFSAAQTLDEESNWRKEIGKEDDYNSRFDFRRYTKIEIETAKAKYLRIASAKTNDEWAGTYRRQTMLGSSEITWDKKNGFVYTYIYHTLANIDYGSTKSTDDSVSFFTEKATVRKWKRFIEGEHIRVTFGEKLLLVPKSRLNDFAVWAVGREVPTGRREKEIYSEDGFFWEKAEDEDKEITDVPIYPARYAHLVRKPIKSRIRSVGSLRIKREKSATWGTTSEDHLVSLRLSSGRRQGVRVGMRFWVDDLEEWIDIISVSTNQSLAEVSRPIINGKEYCDKYENSKQIEFPCRNPRTGMSVRTRVDYF